MIKSKVKTKEGTEPITAYTVEELPPVELHFHKKRRNKRTYLFAEEFITLDTETSHTDTLAWIYQWAARIGNTYAYGRKPQEIVKLLEVLRDRFALSDLKKVIVYVHNLAYDLQYLKHYLYGYDSNLKILATDAHSYLIADVNGFRLICSWKLSNMSLDLLSKTYGTKYEKAVGEIDYTVKRYQDTELSESDWYYMFSDVASQHDGLTGLLKAQGYNYCFDAPFTSTGFVRNDCRKASEKALNWRKNFRNSMLDLEQYSLCKQAFMGGLTICSWKYAGKTVRGDLGHKDFTSSYPARQMMDYFPKGKPSWYGEVETESELEALLDTYCCVFLLHLHKVQIKEGITAPCIPSSKCILLENALKVNGKVIYADELVIAVTEIDYKWIIRQYYIHGGLEVSKMLIFQRGVIPAWMKQKIMQYYDAKCNLKHSDYRLYMGSKAKLNGIYGMSATAIIRDKYELDNELIMQKGDVDRQAELDRFYNSRNSFLPYQYSLYTTAWARDALLQMIECVGYDNFLYCDTDSVFYIKTESGEKALNAYNENIKNRAIKAGAYIGDNILGYATDEDPITAFRGLHSKCYAMIENGKLKVTIAGITKSAVKWIDGKPVRMTNAEELGDIDNLRDGFVFRHNGGTRAIYLEGFPQTVTVDGHPTDLASGVIIENIEKEISNTMFTYGANYELLDVKPFEVL